MDMFEWEPVEDVMYPESIMATETAGLFFDVLHVEKSNEGWHAMLLSFQDAFGLVDESVLDTEEAAQVWAEQYDVARMEAKAERGDATEDEEAWLAMLDER